MKRAAIAAAVLGMMGCIGEPFTVGLEADGGGGGGAHPGPDTLDADARGDQAIDPEIDGQVAAGDAAARPGPDGAIAAGDAGEVLDVGAPPAADAGAMVDAHQSAPTCTSGPSACPPCGNFQTACCTSAMLCGCAIQAGLCR